MDLWIYYYFFYRCYCGKIFYSTENNLQQQNFNDIFVTIFSTQILFKKRWFWMDFGRKKSRNILLLKKRRNFIQWSLTVQQWKWFSYFHRYLKIFFQCFAAAGAAVVVVLMMISIKRNEMKIFKQTTINR